MKKTIFVIAGLFVLSVNANADVIWDESSLGDLANSPLAPTMLEFGVGDNTVTGTIGGLIALGGDQFDRFTFTVGAGLVWSGLLVDVYDPTENNPTTGFEYYSGNVIDFDGSLGTSLGSFFPINVSHVGVDILDSLGGPFGSGEYAVGLRENNPGQQYSLTFQVSTVPEPGTLALLGLGLIGMAARRRRKV